MDIPPVITETAAEEIAEVRGCFHTFRTGCSPTSQPQTPPTVPTDRPKSPWTPSYSVTRQGSTPLASPARATKELDDLEELPPPAEEKPSILVEEQTAVPAVEASEVGLTSLPT